MKIKYFRYLIFINFITITIFFLQCCNGSGSNLEGTYSVKDVNILAKDIEIEESVRVEVFFDTKYEVDGTPDGLDLIVRIPQELEFMSGSSRIYDSSVNDSDPYTPNQIVDCPTGETYLVYNFLDFDLFNRELGSPGSFGIKFEVIGKTKISSTFLGATAGRGDDFACAEQFNAEENEAVQVL